MDIKRYEKMMKLDLPEGERAKIQGWAEMLVQSFEDLEEISTQGIEPMFTVLTQTNVLREDVPKKLFTREEMLKNAPEQYEGYFQVPKTLD